MTIDQCVVKHILVDTGSFINSFFTNNFNQMGISWNHVLPYAALLVGFFGQTTSEGEITLPVSVNDTADIVEFLIVPVSSPYNCIIGYSANFMFEFLLPNYL